jgi:hypothetical protein
MRSRFRDLGHPPDLEVELRSLRIFLRAGEAPILDARHLLWIVQYPLDRTLGSHSMHTGAMIACLARRPLSGCLHAPLPVGADGTMDPARGGT